MKLSKEQIEELFTFTHKKGVRWYDLQCELVDHLALQIEAEISKDPHLSFEEAVKIIYKRFGIFGFSKIVQEKEAQVRKQGNKLWWKPILLAKHFNKREYFTFINNVIRVH